MDRRSIQYPILAALALALLPAATLAETALQTGQWALQDSKPQIQSRMIATTSRNGTTLDIVQTMRGSTAPIGHYTIEQTRVMHLIVVRDDFREFQHLHPELRRGHFTIPVALAAGHRYYIYADSTPAGLSQQVFRFVAGAGTPPRTRRTTVGSSNPTALVGPYTVRLSSTRVVPQRPVTLYATVTKNGTPATDLHPYLGAAAHIVLLNTSTLSYAHVHPAEAHGSMHMTMEMPSDPVNAKIPMTLPPLSRHAAYKLWLQFQGGTTVYTAPFTLTASP